jgi:hypothetical protein
LLGYRRRRKPHLDIESSAGLDTDTERCGVSSGDRLDDGEAEAVAFWMIRSLTVESLEWLREAPDVIVADVVPLLAIVRTAWPASVRVAMLTWPLVML